MFIAIQNFNFEVERYNKRYLFYLLDKIKEIENYLDELKKEPVNTLKYEDDYSDLDVYENLTNTNLVDDYILYLKRRNIKGSRMLDTIKKIMK